MIKTFPPVLTLMGFLILGKSNFLRSSSVGSQSSQRFLSSWPSSFGVIWCWCCDSPKSKYQCTSKSCSLVTNVLIPGGLLVTSLFWAHVGDINALSCRYEHFDGEVHHFRQTKASVECYTSSNFPDQPVWSADTLVLNKLVNFFWRENPSFGFYINVKTLDEACNTAEHL